MTYSTNNRNIVMSVKNALRILKLYRDDRTELGITEMATYLSLPKSTVHRLVQELVKEGLLLKRTKINKYSLGLTILSLGGIVQIQHELYKEAEPIIQQLSEKFGNVANLCLIENKKIVYLLRHIPEVETEITTATGFTKDIHCTAEGQAILAFQHPLFIEQFVSQPLKQYTAYTHTGMKLQQQLDKVYQQGYAITESTYVLGYTSFAAPIRDYTGAVVSSVALIAHDNQIDKKDYPVIYLALKKAANEISKLLGYYH